MIAINPRLDREYDLVSSKHREAMGLVRSSEPFGKVRHSNDPTHSA